MIFRYRNTPSPTCLRQCPLRELAGQARFQFLKSATHSRFLAYMVSLALLHLLALLIFVPGFFSWSGLILAIVGHVVFDGLGVSIGYHRLLTHRGFECPKWFEHLVAILGVCTLQDSPARWVAVHRIHHQHSDHQPDPHSPLAAFLWGHVGWLLVIDRRHDYVMHFERYVRDLLRDPFYLFLEKRLIVVVGLSDTRCRILRGWSCVWLVLLGQFSCRDSAWPELACMGCLRANGFTLHVTWAVNSVAHMWGYRNYETRDNSRNNWLVAAVTFGEGWHNNHHADQRSAAHGHRWWELDPSWWDDTHSSIPWDCQKHHRASKRHRSEC